MYSTWGFTASSIQRVQLRWKPRKEAHPKPWEPLWMQPKKCKSPACWRRRIQKIPAVRPAVVRGRGGSGLGAESQQLLWVSPKSRLRASHRPIPHTLWIFIAPTQTFFDYLRTSSPSSISYRHPSRQSSTNAQPVQLRNCWRSWRWIRRGLMWFNGI